MIVTEASDSEDRLLVPLLRVRDREARERFATKYWAPLFRFVCRFVDPEDAEDVAQWTIMKVIESLPNGAYDDSKGALRNWIFQIARNRALSLLRQQREVCPIGDYSGSPRSDNTDFARAFWACVERLSPDKVELMMQRKVDKTRLGTIAGNQDWRPSTTSVRLSETKRELRKCLAEKGIIIKEKAKKKETGA